METSHPSCKWEEISAVDTYYSRLVPDILLAVFHRSTLRCCPKALTPDLRTLCTVLLPHNRVGHSCQRKNCSFSCTLEWFALQSKQVNAIPCNYRLSIRPLQFTNTFKQISIQQFLSWEVRMSLKYQQHSQTTPENQSSWTSSPPRQPIPLPSTFHKANKNPNVFLITLDNLKQKNHSLQKATLETACCSPCSPVLTATSNSKPAAASSL